MSGDSRVDLVLSLAGESYAFPSPREFEFALSGRTSLPAAKIGILMAMADDALLREAEAIRAVERRFAEALSGALDDVTSIGSFLHGLDPGLISQDHDWRAIFQALDGCDEAFEDYRKVALVKYMQYLTARQECLRTIHDAREPVEGPGGARRGEDPPQRETVIFDVEEHRPAPPPPASCDSFSRVPKGETVELELEPDQEVELLLARHRCRIALHGALVFVDEQGRNSALPSGRAIVGRDASSDIVIDPRLRDISRKHLILESDGRSRVRLTDISSHGTSLPPNLLDSTSI